jgi:hypothetical protein
MRFFLDMDLGEKREREKSGREGREGRTSPPLFF